MSDLFERQPRYAAAAVGGGDGWRNPADDFIRAADAHGKAYLARSEAYAQKFKMNLNDGQFAYLQRGIDSGVFDDGEVYKQAASMYIGNRTNMPSDFVREHLDYFTAALNIDDQQEGGPAGFWRRVYNRYRIGDLNTQANELKYELRGAKNPEWRAALMREIERLENEAEQYYAGEIDTSTAKGKALWALGTMAETLPYMRNSWWRTVAGNVVGKFVGVPFLGEFIGWIYGLRVEGGALYYDLIKKGVDEDIAEGAGFFGGALSSAVEQLLMGVIKGGAKGIKGMITGTEATGRLSNYIVSHVFKNLQPGSAGYRAWTLLADYLLQIPEEGAEEGFQSIVTNIAELIAINIHNARMEGDIAGLPEEEQEAIRALRQVQKKSAGEIAAEVAGEAGAGMVAAFGTGGLSVTFKAGASIREAQRLQRAARESGSFAEFARDAARSPNFEGLREEDVAGSIQKLWEDGEQFREKAEAARAEELRARRLYRSIDQSGEEYRGGDGNLYAELTRHVESGGLETGEYVVGNGRKGEENAHAVISYEKRGDKTEITSVNIGEKYEHLRAEILQNFANEIGEAVTLDGESYQPAEGAAKARRFGFDAGRRQGRTAQAFRFGREYYSAPDSEADTAAKRSFAEQLRKLDTKVRDDAAVNTVVDFYDTAGRKWFGMGFDAFMQKLGGGKPEGLLQTLEYTDAEVARWIAKNEGAAADPAAIRRIQENLTGAQREQFRESVYGLTVPGADGAVKAIKAARSADVSTFIHEGVHAFTHLAKAMDPELHGQMMEAAGFSQEAYEKADAAGKERMMRDAMETLAYGAEAYLKEGPQSVKNSALRGLYERIKEFLKDLKYAAKKAKYLTPEVRALFDALFGEEADGAPTETEGSKTARDGADAAKTANDTAEGDGGRQKAASGRQGANIYDLHGQRQRLQREFGELSGKITNLNTHDRNNPALPDLTAQALAARQALDDVTAKIDYMEKNGLVYEPASLDASADELELFSDSFDRIIKDESRPIEERSEAVVRKAEQAYGDELADEAEQNFKNELRQAKAGAINPGRLIRVSAAPGAYAKHGLPDYNIFLPAAVITKATASKHKVGTDVIERLPELLASPVMILKSLTDPKAFVTVLDAADQEGKPVIVVQKPVHKPHKEITNILSIYGKDNFDNFIKNCIEQDKVIAADKNKAIRYARPQELQLLKGVYLDDLSSTVSPISTNLSSTFNKKINSPDSNSILYSEAFRDAEFSEFMNNYPEVVKEAARFDSGAEMAEHYADYLAMPDEAYKKALAAGYFDALARAAKAGDAGQATNAVTGVSAKKAAVGLAAYGAGIAHALEAARLARQGDWQGAVRLLEKQGVPRIDAETYADTAKVFSKPEMLWLGRAAEESGVPADTAEQRAHIINDIKSLAVPMDEQEFSQDVLYKLFPRGYADTPIGKVKLGKNQYEKLQDRDEGGRQILIGAMHQTLTDPVVIIEETQGDRTALVYIKSFTGGDTGGIKAVNTVVVTADGEKIAISTYQRKLREIERKIKMAGSIVYEKNDSDGRTNGSNSRQLPVLQNSQDLSSPDKAKNVNKENAAEQKFFDTLAEGAKELYPDNEIEAQRAEIAGAGRTAADFIEWANTEKGFNDLVSKAELWQREGPAQGHTDEETRRNQAAADAARTTFNINNPNWKAAFESVKGYKQVPERTKKILRGMIRNRPLQYMEAWAVMSGDDTWLPEENDIQRIKRLDTSGLVDEEYLESQSPEELERIGRRLGSERIKKKIDNGTLKLDDAELDAYEEERKAAMRTARERIGDNKEKLKDYRWMLETAERNARKEQMLLEQGAADTSEAGLKASRERAKKLAEAQRQVRDTVTQMENFMRGDLSYTQRRAFEELRKQLGEREKIQAELQAIGELREILKRDMRMILRKTDLKTVHLAQARLIGWIQSHFDSYTLAARWVGPGAKSIRKLYNEFVTDPDYRRKLKARLYSQTKNSLAYSSIERAIYRDIQKGDARQYGELSSDQRKLLRKYLVDYKGIFEELGIDYEDAPRRFSAAEYAAHEAYLKDFIPSDILAKLQGLTGEDGNRTVKLDDWTAGDAQRLAGIVNQLRKEGRENEAARRDARRELIEERIAKTRRTLLENMPKKAGKSLTRGTAAEKLEKEKRAGLRHVWYALHNGRRFFRSLEGGVDGYMDHAYTQAEYEAFNQEWGHALARREKVKAEFKEAGIKETDLVKFQFTLYDGTRATLDEMLTFYYAQFNERALHAAVFGNFATLEERRMLEAMAGSGDLAGQMNLEGEIAGRYWADMAKLDAFFAEEGNEKYRKVMEIIGRDYDENYGRLKEFVAREYNEELGSEPYYMPLKRLGIVGVQETEAQIALADYGLSRYINKGYTKGRVDIPSFAQEPIQAGFFATWDGMVQKQEHLMAYDSLMRQTKAVFEGRDSASKAVTEALRKGYSDAAVDFVKKWTSELAMPPVQEDLAALNTINRIIRGHYPAAVLGWRVASILKQAIESPPPFLQYMGLDEYVKAGISCLRKETRDMIYAKSVYLNVRYWEPAAAVMGQMEKMYLAGKIGKAEAALAKAENWGMAGQKVIDAVCVMPGWLGAYNKKIAELNKKGGKGMTAEQIERKAVCFADRVVRDCQPSSVTADQIMLLKGSKNPFARMFMQFQTPMASIFQQLFIDAPNNIKQGLFSDAPLSFRARKILDGLWTWGIYAIVAALIGWMHDEPEDKDTAEEWLKNRGIDMATAWIESIPMFGGKIAYGVESLLKTGKIRTFRENNFPVADSGVRAVNAITEEDWGKALSNTTDMLFYLTGGPAGAKKDIERAAEEGNWYRVLGIKGKKKKQNRRKKK